MKDFNLKEKELKELLKSSIMEESSSHFTEQMMLKIASAQEEQATRKVVQSRRRNMLVVFFLASAFIINLIFLFSNGDIFYQDLTFLLTDHFMMQRLDTSQITLASVTLAFGIWILIFMDRKINANGFR